MKTIARIFAIMLSCSLAAQAASMAVVCVAVTVSVTAGVVVVKLNTCKPSVKCLHEGDPGEAGTNWCQAITAREASLSGLQIMGCYSNNITACQTNCSRIVKGGSANFGETVTGTVVLEERIGNGPWTPVATDFVWDDEPFLCATRPRQSLPVFYRGVYCPN